MNQRLLSLDIFRGMTIFFMIVVNTPGTWDYVYAPLRHASWDGCTPTDLVFPFFMFIVGVSMSISYSGAVTKGQAFWRQKAVTRGLTIVLIGILLNWFPFYTKSLTELRIFGVLQRIGLAFLVAALLITVVRKTTMWWLVALLLSLYTGVLMLAGEGALTLEGNLVRTIDLWLLGESHMYKGYGLPFDPEGLLSTVPAIGTVLLGYITGLQVQSQPSKAKLVRWLLILGPSLAGAAILLHFLGLPINKPIWSSSYVLFTGGLAMAFLAFLLWVIDIRQWSNWATVFKPFGLNPLVSYILSGLFVKTAFLVDISGKNAYQWIYSNVFQPGFGNYLGSFLFAIIYTMFIWFFAWMLYRKGTIIKV